MLTKLFEKLAAREKKREVDFWAMARKLAAGEKVAPAVVERLLAASGKTPDDLRAALALLQQRRQWFEVVAGVGALEQERAAIHQRLAAEDRKLEEAERAHADATASLRARLDAISDALREVRVARERLVDTCPYADLKVELSDTTRRIAELRTRAYELRRTIGECDAAAKSDAVQVELDDGKAGYWLTKAEEHRRQGQAAKAELAEVERELAALESRENELRTRMLSP